MDSRYYPGVEADVSKLVAELRNIFDQDYEVQTLHVSSSTVVQARKSSTLRDLTGLSAALTIRVTRHSPKPIRAPQLQRLAIARQTFHGSTRLPVHQATLHSYTVNETITSCFQDQPQIAAP